MFRMKSMFLGLHIQQHGAYVRMILPPLVPVDSDVTVEQVLRQLKKILKEDYQIDLPEVRMT
ncbi:hypothetical protein J6590_058395 [Homalodisca vitripennis]|nr:hypothetical protein J6590_058395 [Homalodisca vitripennis]